MNRRPSIPSAVVLVVIGAVVWGLTRAPLWAVAIAVLVGWAIMKAGFAVFRSLAVPLPEPPPPGELRKVRISFRCSICGTEVRMTTANDEVPEPPRHCQEEMDLVAPIE